MTGMMIFPKALLGGLGAVVLAWIVIICVWYWRLTVDLKHRGLTGPFGVSGGWAHLLHTPAVVALLAIAFGCGLYLAARVSS